MRMGCPAPRRSPLQPIVQLELTSAKPAPAKIGIQAVLASYVLVRHHVRLFHSFVKEICVRTSQKSLISLYLMRWWMDEHARRG